MQPLLSLSIKSSGRDTRMRRPLGNLFRTWIIAKRLSRGTRRKKWPRKCQNNRKISRKRNQYRNRKLRWIPCLRRSQWKTWWQPIEMTFTSQMNPMWMKRRGWTCNFHKFHLSNLLNWVQKSKSRQRGAWWKASGEEKRKKNKKNLFRRVIR